MRWTPLKIGKHEGKTLPQVMFSDPDWFFWAYEKGIFVGHQLEEAREIYRKSQSIRVPQSGGRKNVVEIIIDKPSGKFGTISRINEPEGPHGLYISDVIDMSIPRKICQHDKTGYHNFLIAMKAILFGDSRRRMTKKRCEEFFENNDNFLVSKGILIL